MERVRSAQEAKLLLWIILFLLFIFKLQNVTGEMGLECYFRDAPGPGVGGMMWDGEGSQQTFSFGFWSPPRAGVG